MAELMKTRSISSTIVCDTAKDMGYTIEIINKDKNLFVLKNWEKEKLFKNIDCWINNSLSLKICGDKELTYNILWRHWIRIAQSIYLNKSDVNKFNLENINIRYPLVVKPIDEWHWNWVYTDIKNIDELNSTISNVFDFSDNIIIQEHIEWNEHRILVIWGKVIFGARRINAYIIGDGKKNINDLIKKENTNPLRGCGYDKPMSFINIDKNLKKHIKKYYDYTVTNVPKKWEEVILRWVSNVWAGWFIKDVTKELWDEFKQECVKIAKVLWLNVAWIDIITNDLSKSLDKSKWVVLEVWSTPWFWWYTQATGINPAEHLLNFVFNND